MTLFMGSLAPPTRASTACLATDLQYLFRPYRAENCQNIRNKREQVAESVTASYQDHHAERQHTNLLLIDEVAVDRYGVIKAACRDVEKIAVLLSRSSGLGYSLHLMVPKVLLRWKPNPRRSRSGRKTRTG